MRTTAFLFPGQGSQEVGMGADLFERSDLLRTLLTLASDMVHHDLRTLCLKGPERDLIKARFLQPLLSAVSLAYHEELAQRGIKPDIILGHSLGEITSLAAAGAVSAEDAVRMAAKRGELMDEAAGRVQGGMMAVLFVPLAKVEELLDELAAPQRIVLANDNADDQVVLSGDDEMLGRFAALVEERKLGRCKRITVAGPWHSPYLTEARHTFEKWVEPIPFHRPTTRIVLNALGREESHPTTIKHLITYQLTSPVYWRECMKSLLASGVDTLVEVGPGRVLTGLARVNGFRKNAEAYNANNLRGVEQVAAALGGQGEGSPR